LKANKKTAPIFLRGPIKNSGRKAFRDGQQLETPKFLTRANKGKAKFV